MSQHLKADEQRMNLLDLFSEQLNFAVENFFFFY